MGYLLVVAAIALLSWSMKPDISWLPCAILARLRTYLELLEGRHRVSRGGDSLGRIRVVGNPRLMRPS